MLKIQSSTKRSREDFSLNIIEENGNYFSFLLDRKDNFLANIIRRTMMQGVPTLAVDEVNFKYNRTIHIDDIISKRLGLVPIVSGDVVREMKMKDECKCDVGCENCSISFSLKGDYENGMVDVTSFDIKIDSDKVIPTYFTYSFNGKDFREPFPIVNLGETHGIELSGKIRKGNGYMNAKWNPVCMVVYEEKEDGTYFNVETSGSLKPQELLSLTEEIVKEIALSGNLVAPKPK